MIIYSQSTIRKVFVPLLSWIIWEGHVERMLFLFWPCPLLFSPLFRGNLKCHCTVISHLMHSDKISLSILHVCFTDIFRGTKHLKMPSCTKKKKGIGSRYFFWLLTVKNMALSEVSKLSFIFIKCKSDFRVLLLASFEFMHWISDKGDSEKLQTITQDQNHSVFPVLWEKDWVLQREEAQSVQKNHIYPSAKCFMPLQCWDQICLCMPIFQKKSLGFSRLVVEYASANQPDKQIRYASICTEPGHKP